MNNKDENQMKTRYQNENIFLRPPRGSLKYVVFLFLIFQVMGSRINGQQQANWSSFYENGFMWNPALTARWNTVETSIIARQDWIGFEGAPRTANVGFQYPFVKRFTRVAAGGYINYDEVGPFQNINAGGTYVYKIRPRWMGNRLDVLSFGARVSMGQYRFVNDKTITFEERIDPNLIDDPSGFQPDVGFGVYYATISDLEIHKSHYYFGLSANNLVPTSVNTGAKGGFTNIPHLSIHGGYRYYPFGQTDVFYEPNAFLSYAFTKAYSAAAGFRCEYVDRFWMSGGMVTTGEVFGQLGFIFNRESVLGPIVRDGELRVGAKVDYSLGTLRRYAGMGFEVYAAYLISNEPY